MPSERDVAALASWDIVSEPSDPYEQPLCDCCQRVDVNRPGDICAACEPELAVTTRPPAPSLPMDLCSDIPEDGR